MPKRVLTEEEARAMGLDPQGPGAGGGPKVLSPEEAQAMGLNPEGPGEEQSALEVGLSHAAPLAAEIGAVGAGLAEAPKKMMEGGAKAALDNYMGWRDKLYGHMEEGAAQHPDAAAVGTGAQMLTGAAGLARSGLGRAAAAGLPARAAKSMTDGAHAGMSTYAKAFGEGAGAAAKPAGIVKDTLQTTARHIAQSPGLRNGIEKGAQVFRKLPPELVELTPFGGKVQAGVRVAQKALNAAKAYGGPTKNLGVAGAVGAGAALGGEEEPQEMPQEAPGEPVVTREALEAAGHRFEPSPIGQKLAQRAQRALADHLHSGRIGEQQLLHARGAVNWCAANMQNPYYMKQAIDKIATEPGTALTVVQGIMAGMIRPEDEEQQP